MNGAVAIAGDKLYAAWKTGDPRLLQNAGDVPNALFKSGGALDLMIGTDSSAKPSRPNAAAGDVRLLVAQVNGKTKALLYREIVPGTQDKDKVPFNAPWHGITFDQVVDVSDQVQLEADKAGNYQVTVPLALLGLSPQPGMKIKGDIGVLRGNGRETSTRVYWANKATGLSPTSRPRRSSRPTCGGRGNSPRSRAEMLRISDGPVLFLDRPWFRSFPSW